MASRQPLSRRIVIAFVLMTLLVAGSSAVGIFFTIHQMEERLLSNELSRSLDRLLQMDSMDEWRIDPRPDQRFFFSGGPGEFVLPPDLQALEQGFHEVFRDERWWHVLVRLVGQRHYLLMQDQTDFERREQLFYEVMLGGFLLSLLLAALLGWLLARHVMEPVARLARQVGEREQLQAGATPLAEDHADDEVGQLAAAFDATLDQLRAALARERLFTSDVSHELRTPLMVLVSSCELLLDNPQLPPPARRQVERIARASEGMSDLVQTFLQLARSGNGNASVGQRLTLDEAAAEVCADWRAPIESKGLQLRLEGQSASAAQYDAIFLRAVLGNLLRNAWHYTDSGRITLQLAADGFSVEDTGAGIPQEQRDAVFQPFVRGEQQRGDGLGLGLSLVQRICASQGWQIELSEVQPRGCRFSVQLARVQPVACSGLRVPATQTLA